MTTNLQKYLIERVICYLRGKKRRLNQIDVQCTLDEILQTFNEDERKEYECFRHQKFKKEFADIVQHNPKIQFNLMRELFTTKKRFQDPNHFLKILFDEKIGVLEDDDLYDDLKKEDIQKLKNAGLLREIFIKEKKTKPAVKVLFTKNHPQSETDKLNLEEKTTDFLKKYWNRIEEQALVLEQGLKFQKKYQFERNNKIKKKDQKGIGSRNQKNVKNWKNNFLQEKIEKALKELDEMVELAQKGKIAKKFQLIEIIFQRKKLIKNQLIY